MGKSAKQELFSSERLEYRIIEIKDAEVLHKFRNEESYRRWMGFLGPPPTLDDIIKSINSDIDRFRNEVNIIKGVGRGIYLKKTSELIGNIGIGKFHGPDEELEYVEVGFDIGEAYQNKGYATEATKAIVAWGFTQLRKQGLEPIIQSRVEHGNTASRRVLEKAGFTFIRDEKYVSMFEIRN